MILDDCQITIREVADDVGMMVSAHEVVEEIYFSDFVLFEVARV